jgi:hypothetical protein
MNEINRQMIMFVVMFLVGIAFNPMNILAYRISDLYFSQTLFYSGLLMASNMMWAHELVHYASMGHLNTYVFFFGIGLSIVISALLLRNQWRVDDSQYLRRMIGHHSTALTTSHQIYRKTKDPVIKTYAKNIIQTQEKEIQFMKSKLI